MTAREMLMVLAGEQLPGLNLWRAAVPVRRGNRGGFSESFVPSLESAAESSKLSPAIRSVLAESPLTAFFVGKNYGETSRNQAGQLPQVPKSSKIPFIWENRPSPLSLWQEETAKAVRGGITGGNTASSRLRMGEFSETAVLLSGLKERAGKSYGVDTERIFAELERRLAIELGAG